MKTIITAFTVAFVSLSQLIAEDTAKPLLSLSVKRQLTKTDQEKIGARAEVKDKIVTLRVVIRNVSSSTIDGASISGDVLLERSMGQNEKIVKESLAPMKIPEMKPNASITIDLGKIKLSKVEWKNREFEETLEEWQVVCKKDETVIGKDISSDKYTTLEKEIKPEKPGDDRPRDQRQRKLRKLIN